MKKSKSSGKRSVAIGGNVERSTLNTGDETVLGHKFGGDTVGGDKNVYINQVTSSAVNALHQLRAAVGDFVGRNQEIGTLVKALRGGSHVGINGMGGIGKTELALLVAEHVAGAYPDAQFFINLQGADDNPRSPDEVLAMCIRAFVGAEAALPQDRDQLLQCYRSALSGKRVLLLLDNAADSAQVQPLLPPPGSVVMMTSRQTVTLPGIIRLKLNPLTDDEAQKLLLEIAPHAKRGAAQICELCGYLPLAIRAAGSLLAVTEDLDPVGYANQLADERNRLERIGKEGVEIDLAASFNLSYERLKPEAAQVFRLLSVFPGTFDASAEEAICEDPEHAELTELVRRSLVLYDSGTRRYRLHDLARLFAASKLTDGERARGHRGHAAYYQKVLADANALYLQGGEALSRGLALFDLEWNNIQAGQAWVAAQGIESEETVELVLTYPDAGLYVLNLRLPAREWIRWLEISLAAARKLNSRSGESVTLGNLGVAYRNLGEPERAIQLLEQQLNIVREFGDRRGECNALGNLGNAYYDLGETRRAIEFHEQLLTIARELGVPRIEGSAFTNLGNAYCDLGETEQGIRFYEQALAIDRKIGDRRGEGADLGNLGAAYADLGDPQRAIEFYEQQLTIVREIGDLAGEGNALCNMSLVLSELGKGVEALRHAEQALAIFDKIEHPNAARVRALLAAWREESTAP